MALQENPPFQLFLWCLIYFWTDKITSIFLTIGGCTAFGILLQVNTSLMLLHPRRRPDPCHLFGSRIITSRFSTHSETKMICVCCRGLSGAFLTISQPGFLTFPKTRSSIPSPGRGKRSDSLPDSLLRPPCDEAQTLLSPSSKKFSHSAGAKHKESQPEAFRSIHTSDSHSLSEFQDLKHRALQIKLYKFVCLLKLPVNSQVIYSRV